METKDIDYQFGYALGELTAIVEKALPNLDDTGFLKDGKLVTLVADQPSKIDYWLVQIAKAEHGIAKGVKKNDLIDTLDRYYKLLEQIDLKAYSTKNDQGFWFGYYHTKARGSMLVTRQRLGQRIKQLREERKLSQRELAGMADIGYPHLCRIEKGDYNVSVDILARLGTALGVELTLS